MLSPWQSIVSRIRSAGFNATAAVASFAIILSFAIMLANLEINPRSKNQYLKSWRRIQHP